VAPARRGGGEGVRRLALEIAYRWPADTRVLPVQFLDNLSTALRKRILSHMNAWNQTVDIRFMETAETGTVRIARLSSPPDDAGYWSYIGTQILGIDEDKPTLNLDGFTMNKSEAEFRRVVRHEAGHTLGFEHEHMRADLIKKIDKRKAIAYYAKTEHWSEKDTMAQVLTPLSEKSLMGTAESDPVSIMCYQIPAKITKDGVAIPGGVDINPRDYEFAGTIYPKTRGDGAEAAGEALAPDKPEIVDAGVPELARPLLALPAVPFVAAGQAPLRSDAEFHLVILEDFDSETGTRRVVEYEEGKKTPRFAQVYASYDGARVSCPMQLRRRTKEEEATAFGQIIGTHERIKTYTNEGKGTLPSAAELIEFGGYLFEALFQGNVRRLYDEARGRQRSGKLTFVITSMVSWLAEKPWEFAYDPVRCRFLATEEILLLRNVLTAVPADLVPAWPGPLRILVAAAQPVGLVALSAEQEIEVIRRGFEPLIQAGLAEVEVLPRVTPGDLQRTLSTGSYNVVHFIGHGRYDEDKEEAWLVFENSEGGRWELDARGAREIFCQRGLSLVFLNACQTGSGGRADFNKGMAQALAAHGLPALVANQYSVLDTSATAFAGHFYWALAHGMAIGQAAAEARIAVNYSLGGELIDWAVPVVYARDPLMTLCPKRDRPLTPLSRSLFTRRAAGFADGSVQSKPVMKVAVWDVDNSFPALESTLAWMNGCQSAIGFKVAALSSPLDIWDMDQGEGEGDSPPYLNADRAAKRLGRIAPELGVDVLACITRHFLRDEITDNLYGWWPDAKQPPVVIFSCAGLDLAPAGPATDSAIANVMVTLLSGFLTGEGSHRDHPGCPRYFNGERNVGGITGRQKFDAGCLKLLREKAPAETPALEALLDVFPAQPFQPSSSSHEEKTRILKVSRPAGRQKKRPKGS
jgi:hypothetical protein